MFNIAETAGEFTDPFRIMTFRPFTEEIYSDILENLPDDHLYVDQFHEDSPKGSRKILLLDQLAPPFWQQVAAELCSKKVAKIFGRRLGFEGPFISTVRLMRDFAGYKINPHQDSSKKVCTVQFYLPSNESQLELGTSFYAKSSDGSFIEKLKLKFLPNTGYAFKVSNNSWHGCDFKVLDKPRDTLLLTYYKAKK